MYSGKRDKHLEIRYIERLWDGNLGVYFKLEQLRDIMLIMDRNPLHAFKWLLKNELIGEKVIHFFNYENGEETAGIIKGAKFIINRIDQDKFNKDPLRRKQ